MRTLEQVIAGRSGISATAVHNGRAVQVTYYEHSYKNFWVVYDVAQSRLSDEDVHVVFEDDTSDIRPAVLRWYDLDVDAPIWGRGGL